MYSKTKYSIMSEKLFFYNRIEKVKESEESTVEIEKTFRDSINVDNILRTIQIADNLVVVILNDGREEKFEVPVSNKGKMEIQSQRKFIQTQIPIEGVEQVQAFFAKLDS